MKERELSVLLEMQGNAIRRYSEGEFMRARRPVPGTLYPGRRERPCADGESRCKQLTIDHLQAVELLAPAFLFASENRFPVNLEAQERCEVIAVGRDNFLEAMHGNPRLMQNFLQVISERSLFLSRKLNEFALLGLKERLLNFLKLHGTINNQQEVAYILGVARPSLARALSELAAEGRIRIEGKKFVVLDDR